MVAEFILTPAESKWLIAKSLSRTRQVRQALQNGIVAMHPSSSTYFLHYELTGCYPDVDRVWLTGLNAPKGMCVEANTQVGKREQDRGLRRSLANADSYPHTYIYRKGKPVNWTLGELVERMKEGDVYIKGVNGMDRHGNVGVQIGSLDEYGTIGRVVKGAKERGFAVTCPVGYEKFLPGDLSQIAKRLSHKPDYAMGICSKLFVFRADIHCETDALRNLCGVETTVFAAGGVAGAEGSVCLAVEGTGEQVREAIRIVEGLKGAVLPKANVPDCLDCCVPTCHFCGKKKPWITE